MLKKLKNISFYFKSKADIKQKKLELIDEQKSPLFRIMSIFNDNEPSRRKFENNICAFHVGNGFIMSVAHNLRIKAAFFHSVPEQVYQDRIIQRLNPGDVTLFNRNFIQDQQTNKRYLSSTVSQNDINQLVQKLKDIRFDSRYLSMYRDSICKPFLIIQFRNNVFYNNQVLTNRLNNNYIFHEAPLFRYTFLFELELVEAFYNQDIALYRIINTDQDIIDTIPSVKLNFEIYDKSENNFFCLQSAPIDNLGRLLNEARIEGLLDHWNIFKDDFQGDYIFEGLRYLIKGYFRFGSSGAPYLIYSLKEKEFEVNAVQSEASPIQLSINNSRNGNFQYINAIASPLKIVEDRLKNMLH